MLDQEYSCEGQSYQNHRHDDYADSRSDRSHEQTRIEIVMLIPQISHTFAIHCGVSPIPSLDLVAQSAPKGSGRQRQETFDASI